LKNTTTLSLSVAMLFVAAGAAAQTAPDIQRLASQLKRNQEELQNYTWQANYTYTVNGAQRRNDVYRIRTINGFRERMQLKSEATKEPLRRGNGKKLSKKERQAAYEWALNVKKQLDGYLNPLFSEKAVLTAKTATEGELLILRSFNVMTDGDSVVIRYDKSTQVPKSASIATLVDGSPVSLEVEFGSMEYGPNYAARSVTTGRWQEFDLVISTVNSNFERKKY
jgi:hypothetical protein